MPKARDSFGVQAAKFSMYAPVVAFLLGTCLVSQPGDSTAAAKTMAGVRSAIAILNTVLIVGGLGLGVAALASTRKYGRDGILVRALVGVGLNGLLLAVAAVTLGPLLLGGPSRSKVVGHWRGPVGDPAHTVDVTFAADGTYTFTNAGTALGPAAVDGQWVYTADRVIGLTVGHVTVGNPAAVGKQIGLGRVRSATGSELVLATDHGDERFVRQ